MGAPSQSLKASRLSAVSSSLVLFSAVLCSVNGCGPRDRLCTLQGAVTYGTEAVTEGTVTFEESASKATFQAVISPEGKYALQVTPGTYKIMVEPPLVVETKGSDPGQTFKIVKNIPNKFRLSQSTPLTSTVDTDATLDFNLKK